MDPFRTSNGRVLNNNNINKTTISSGAYPSHGQQWSPAALLNPKGVAKSQKPEANKSNPVQQRSASQMNFSFDSPGGMSPFMQRPQPANAVNPGNSAPTWNQQYSVGVGSMLESMHNLSERDMVPTPKRRKVQEDGQDETKAHFSGGGKGGVLGEYMKEQREQGRKEASLRGTVPAVDLTGGDDAEVSVSAPEDKEVCFGRIEGSEVNAFKVPTSRSPSAGSLGAGYWPPIKLLLKRREADKTSVICVHDCSRSAIGCLDVTTSIGLCPIMDGNLGIRTSARILARQKKAGDLPPGSETSCRYSLDLTLYGPKKHALKVGTFLSQKQLWLRTPMFVEAGFELYNPHVLQKPAELLRPRCSAYVSGGAASRTVEEIRNDVIGMFDKLEQSEALPEMQPDWRISTELLPHQKQALHFMTKKEHERVFSQQEEAENSSLWRLRYGNGGQKTYYNVITGHEHRECPPQIYGGILADMMGLGKTLSILSLIMSTQDTSAQWARLSPPGPVDDEIPLKRNCKATLLVAPLSTITNWEDQITQHLRIGTLKFHIYHGANRIKDIEKLSQFDLIITTYGSVASEFNKRSKKAGDYPLEEINWFRIVLDEAHMIREQATLQSKAICRLQSNRRWAVTGTPVQNRLEDLGALLKFLRLKPFDDKRGFAQYILAPCRNADPDILPKIRLLVDSITLRRLKDRIDLPARHDRLVRLKFNVDEQQLYDVFAKNASDRVAVLTTQKSNSLGGRAYVHILQSILRLRLICAHGKELLGEEDLKVMEGINKASAIDLDSDEEDADRPALSVKQAYDMYRLMCETNMDKCETCGIKIGPQESASEDGDGKDEVIGHMTPCFHIICTKCINSYEVDAKRNSLDGKHVNCSLCREYIQLSFFPLRQNKIDADEEARAEIKDSNGRHKKAMGEYGGPHTKTRALLEDLVRSQLESEAAPDQPPIKSVVFSGWTSHLDLIAVALENAGIKATRLDGKMSRNARSLAMKNFRQDPTIRVILVSIMAGGLGLNLTTANKVYVMEPQYNPAAEAQAVDRVHRLGQKREVETVRYIMEGSFEEKMLILQDKKRKLASLSMDRDASGRGQLGREEANRKRLEDLRSLFK